MKKIIFTIACAAIANYCTALDISIAPGELGGYSPKIKFTLDATLKISGAADVRDLALLKSVSKNVAVLDLSDLRIDEYSYPTGDYLGQKSFQAGELPAHMIASTNVKEIKFPENVQIIGDAAFAGSKIEQVVLPSSVKKIGKYAFASCDNLVSIDILNPVEMGVGVFKDCVKLKELNSGYNITGIPAYSFAGCVSYSQPVPASAAEIGDYAYYGTALRQLNLSNVHKVGNYAFAKMPNVEEIIIAEGNIEFGEGVFFGDSTLSYLPEFKGEPSKLLAANTSGNLSSIVEGSVIGAGAFANNQDIDTLVLGANVKKIEAHAFRNLKKLKMVDVSAVNNVPDADPESFSGLISDNGRYDIFLKTAEGEDDKWKEAPVWTLFDINGIESGVEEISGEAVTLTIARVAGDIDVRSTQPIERVTIYNMSGIILHDAVPMTESYAVSRPASDEVIVVKAVSGRVSKIAKLR
ncbi:MAG: leucine-rich repeat domain-containing protein [Candidatus Amulumruptor caecigallinarius]|nr:leucine-rich repeat domain-containing protein [Candidatus Amulumruptor caecigallinarius]